jgi:hypothetical protein
MVRRERAVTPTKLDRYEVELEHDGRKYAISVPDLLVLKCGNCGEVCLDDAADERLSEALRAAAGLLSPAEIRRGREGAGPHTKATRRLAPNLGIRALPLGDRCADPAAFDGRFPSGLLPIG